MNWIKLFFVGIIVAAGALLFEIGAELILSISRPISQHQNDFLLFIVFVPIIEELFKLFALQRFFSQESNYLKAIPSFLAIGLGFGIFELVITSYQWTTAPQENLIGLFSPLVFHLFSVLLTGWLFLSLSHSRWFRNAAVLPAVLFHLAFNYLIFIAN